MVVVGVGDQDRDSGLVLDRQLCVLWYCGIVIGYFLLLSVVVLERHPLLDRYVPLFVMLLCYYRSS